MTKNEIKAALDLAGVTYAKKANLETLQALFDALPAPAPLPAVADGSPESHAAALANLEAAQQARVAAFLTMDADAVHDADCPHCGIHLSNGLLNVDDHAANSDQSYRELRDPAFEAGEWTCMGCGGHFGQPVTYDPIVPGLKIEKDRPEQNGIKRPSIGGKCRAIWDALDEYRAETGELPTSKTVKELAADSGWNPNNASIEFYQWRKFHGIGKQA